MKSKRSILILYGIVVAIAIALLVFTGKKSSKEEDNHSTIHTQSEHTQSGYVQSETQGEETEQETEPSVTEDNSGREVQAEDVAKLEISILDMTEEVEKQITDMDAFVFAIKDYFYEAGITEKEVRCLNKITFDYGSQLMIFQMHIKTSTITYFEVIYDMAEQTYEIWR